MENNRQRKIIFFTGAKHGIPVALGYFAVSFAFGVLAAEGGLSPAEAALMSLLNVTSAGQFAGLTVILAAGPYAEIALTQLVINLRYALMSLTLSQRVPERTSVLTRLCMAYAVTDEIFALDAAYPGNVAPLYHFGAMSVAVPGWVAGTLAGALAGAVLPERILQALSVALYGMFLAIIIPPARESGVLRGVIAAAMGLSALFSFAPLLREISAGFRIVLITVGLSLLFALLFPVPERQGDAGEAGGAG